MRYARATHGGEGYPLEHRPRTVEKGGEKERTEEDVEMVPDGNRREERATEIEIEKAVALDR